MASLARILLTLPSFLYAVGLMFWCFSLASMTGFVHFWSTARARNDVEGVLKYFKAGFRFRVVKVGSEQLCKKKCVYLANHRSWADFFIDMFTTEARAVPLGRREVGMAFPAFTTSLYSVRCILLFNRSGVRDTEKFNLWLDRQLSKAHQPSLLVYPEGTRSLRDASLPLKRGMLRYAHSRRLPVQVVITTGKEEVLNEKRYSNHFNRTLVTGCSEVVESTEFPDFEEFMAKVQALWDAQWERVHSASPAGLPELKVSFLQQGYSTATLLKQSTSILFWTSVLLWLTLRTLRVLAALATGGTAGQLVLGALGAWVAASFVVAYLPPPVCKQKKQS